MTALEQRLVTIYRRARENLMAEIRRRAQFGRSTAWQQETLKLIDRELRKMKQDVTVWAQDAVQTSFLAGARAGWAATGVSGSFGPFIGLHKRAIQLMVSSVLYRKCGLICMRRDFSSASRFISCSSYT